MDDAKLRPLLDDNLKCLVRNLTEGFGDGGYFNEHAGPGQIASDTAFVPALQAWKVAGGQDFISPRPNASMVTMIRCYELLRGADGKTAYMLRHPSSYGSGTYPDDRNGLSRGGQFAQGFGAVREAYRPALLWVFNHFVEPDVQQRTYDTVSPYPHRAVLALVNWPIGEAEQNPAEVETLPPVLHDSLKHYFVFRNRWRDGDDIVVSGLWGARNDGAEPVMIWGLGERLNWNQCARVGDGAGKSELLDVKPDGSGIVRAGDTWLAVDFSGKSGADALLVMTGPGAAGNVGGGGQSAAPANEALPSEEDLKSATLASAIDEVGEGVPVVKFEPNRVPTRWLFAGPFPTGGTKKNGVSAEDTLAALGGRDKASPAAGTAVKYKEQALRFQPLPERFVTPFNRAGGTAEERVVKDHAIGVLGATGQAFQSTSYFYTVLETDWERTVRFTAGHPDAAAWVGGVPVADGGVVRLPAGKVPLLIEFTIGTKSLLQALPRLEDAAPLANLAAERAGKAEAEAKRQEEFGKGHARATTIRAEGTTFSILTLQKGEAPEVRVQGDKLLVGGQTIRFDGKLIVGADGP